MYSEYLKRGRELYALIRPYIYYIGVRGGADRLKQILVCLSFDHSTVTTF